MFSKSAPITLAAAALLLAACAPFGKQSPLAEPAAFALPDASKNTFSAQRAWWLRLHDKKLNNLIARALQNSPDLYAVKARFDQAQAQLGITEAASQAQIGLTARGAGIYTTPKPSSMQGETNHTLLLANTALQGSWSFDFWGKNRENIAAAIGRRQAVAYEAEQTRILLAQAVAAQYFAWQSLLAQEKLIGQRIELTGRMQQLVERRIRAKLMPSEKLYTIETALQRLEIERLNLNRQTATVRHSLSALTGQTPDALSSFQPEAMAQVPMLPAAKIHAGILAARPDIAAQKALLESKQHSVNATRAEFYPDIELKVLAGLAHIDAFNVVRGRNSGMLGILPALNLPIFTSGALQSKLAGKRAEYNEQVALYDQTVLTAMRHAADAISDYQILASQQAAWQRLSATSQKSLNSARSRVRAGLDNGLNALQKQDESLQLAMQTTAHQAALLTAWSNLHAQLGGGFKAP